MHIPPYVNVMKNGSSLAGIMPSIVQEMVVSCCQFCKSHGKSYLDLELNGYNNSAQEKLLGTVKTNIDGETDIVFPIPGYEIQESYKTAYGFVGVVGTPGVAFVLSITSTEGVMVRRMISSIWGNWSLLIFSLLFAFITGCLIWLLVSN
jgi:hypothetical protein